MASTKLSKPVPDMSTHGVPGLVSYGGFVFDDWLRDMQGPQGKKLLREMMDQDAIIGAILFSLEMLIRQVPWRIEPGDNAQAFTLIDTAIHDMDTTLDATLSEILSFLGYGFSLHELLFKRRDGEQSKYSDGQIGWKGWPMRGQETVLKWDFDPITWEPTAMIQLGPPDWQQHTIPLSKALLFRTTQRRNNPEGRSLLRNCVRSYYLKKHIETIEAIGVERDLAGLPIIWAPPEILNAAPDTNDALIMNSLKNIVKNVKRDDQEGLVMPLAYDDSGNKIYDLTLLSAPGNRQFNTDVIIGRYDQRMTMTTMADFLTLGHERVGSNALAQEKGRLFVAALGSWMGHICDVVNTQAIPQLLRLNGLMSEQPPKLAHGQIERPDEDMMSNVILRMMQAGARLDLSPGSEMLNFFCEMFGMPPTKPTDTYTPPPSAKSGEPSAQPTTPSPVSG